MAASATDTATPAREQWSGQVGFLMAAIGSAVGLGNIWRFPGIAYTNGGGAFIVPYVVALLLTGIPVLFLEYAIGHRYRGSSPLSFARMSRRWEALGWFQVLICFVIMTYYAVIVAWAARYTLYSFTLAWGDDASSFFYNYIGLGSIDDTGTPAYSVTPVGGVIIPLLLVWAFGLIVIARGISRGVEKANRIFLPILVLMFLALVVRAILLPGALDGLTALFTPDWSKLADFHVWLAAFGQIFFSLSVGFGIMLTYASYLKRRSNLVGTGFVAAFANSSFELLAGIGVFSTLGFMARAQGVSVGDLDGISGVALSFVTFPTVISEMPGGPIFGVLFFASFTMAGLTSLISIIQVVAAGVREKFAMSDMTSTLVVGLPSAALSFLLFGTASGLYELDMVDAFINNLGVVLSAIVMCVGVGLVMRQLRPLQVYLNAVSETRLVGAWWRILVAAVVPVLLGVMFVQAAWDYASNGYGGYSASFNAFFGWGTMLVVAVATITLTAMKWRGEIDMHPDDDAIGHRAMAGVTPEKED